MRGFKYSDLTLKCLVFGKLVAYGWWSQGIKLRLIQAPMRLHFSLWRPNPEN